MVVRRTAPPSTNPPKHVRLRRRLPLRPRAVGLHPRAGTSIDAASERPVMSRKDVRAEGSANDACSFVSVERTAPSIKHRHRLRPTGRRSGCGETVGRGDMPKRPRSPACPSAATPSELIGPTRCEDRSIGLSRRKWRKIAPRRTLKRHRLAKRHQIGPGAPRICEPVGRRDGDATKRKRRRRGIRPAGAIGVSARNPRRFCRETFRPQRGSASPSIDNSIARRQAVMTFVPLPRIKGQATGHQGSLPGRRRSSSAAIGP